MTRARAARVMARARAVRAAETPAARVPPLTGFTHLTGFTAAAAADTTDDAPSVKRAIAARRARAKRANMAARRARTDEAEASVQMPVGMLMDVIAKVIRDREWSHLQYIYKVGSLKYNGTWRLHVVTECASLL